MTSAGQSPYSQHILLEVAVGLLRQQYDHLQHHFSEHLLSLQDTFHEGVSARWNEFDVSCRLAAPTVAFGSTEVQRAEERFAALMDDYAATADAEMARFRADAGSVKRDLDALLYQIDTDAKAAERRRFDELTATATLCRRELAATIALVKSERAQGETEVSAIQTLQNALDQVTKELESVRSRTAKQAAEAQVAAAKQRDLLQQELDQLRSTHQAEREQFAATVRKLIATGDEERAKFAVELADVNKTAADRSRQLREQLIAAQNEQGTTAAEIDRVRSNSLRVEKELASEILSLKKHCGSLELEVERLRLQVESEREHSAHTHDDIRRVQEARRNVEVEEFKRRLVDSIAVPTTRGSPSGGSQERGTRFSSVVTQAAEATSSSSGLAPQYSSRSAHHFSAGSPASSPLSSSARHAAVTSPSFGSRLATDRSHSPSAELTLRSPSETFVRLQQLTSTWKDRFAAQ